MGTFLDCDGFTNVLVEDMDHVLRFICFNLSTVGFFNIAIDILRFINSLLLSESFLNSLVLLLVSQRSGSIATELPVDNICCLSINILTKDVI